MGSQHAPDWPPPNPVRTGFRENASEIVVPDITHLQFRFRDIVKCCALRSTESGSLLNRRTELHPFVLVRPIVPHPWLPHLQDPGTDHNRAARLVAVADDQALAVFVAPFLVLVQKLLHLGLNGLLEHLLSTTANQLIEQIASLELFLDVSDFQIDLAHPWHSPVKKS